MTESRSVPLRMRNVSNNSCTENQNTLFTIYFFLLKKRAVYEIMWKNALEPDRPHITIQYGVEEMRFATRIEKARMQTHTRI